MKIAFFDTKSYDKASFEQLGIDNNIKFKFYETKLNEDTVRLASGFDGVCIFVNDTASKAVIDALYEYGVKIIILRCAGFNNVDLKAAEGKITVVRVPSYSPYAVAEHTMALILTSVRRIHKAFVRTKSFNFSLSDLTGFDLYGKTVGVIGTGKIGKIFINICKGFGMNVLAYDVYPDKNADINYTTLDEIFTRSNLEESKKKAKMLFGKLLIQLRKNNYIKLYSLLESVEETDIVGDKFKMVFNDKSAFEMMNNPNDFEILNCLISGIQAGLSIEVQHNGVEPFDMNKFEARLKKEFGKLLTIKTK